MNCANILLLLLLLLLLFTIIRVSYNKYTINIQVILRKKVIHDTIFIFAYT